MGMYTDLVQMRAGATPQTFDGNQTVRFNSKARRITGISMGQSQSIYTTDEGFVIAVRLSENAGLGSKNPIFFMGWGMDSGPASNNAVNSWPPDYLPLNIPVSPNETMRVDISTIAGATQTGTHDVSITIHYDDGSTPSDILYAAAGGAGVVPLKGGTYAYITANTGTAEVAASGATGAGNGTTLNIPGEAREIVAICAPMVIDTAVTASEELGGKVRLEFSGVSDAGKQEYPLSGGSPNLGTEVQGSGPWPLKRLPMYINVSSVGEVQSSAFFTFLSAITGGADAAVNLLWR